ncbi:ATP-binding protein [Pirellulales bacterium]|nr:ATP-binding protein [Pirellulales bacterium]
MLIAMIGLPASGKSTIARRLATELPADVLDKDRIRAALFLPEQIEYSSEQDDFCMDILYQVAGYLLRKDRARHVIVDGRPFGQRRQRESLYQAAERIDAQLCLVECVCSEESANRRLQDSCAKAEHPAANRNRSLYQRLKTNWEPLTEERLVLDTDSYDVNECVQAATQYTNAAGRSRQEER